jgi:hypothetical protein
MKSHLAVRIAETFGWLNIVDEDLMLRYRTQNKKSIYELMMKSANKLSLIYKMRLYQVILPVYPLALGILLLAGTMIINSSGNVFLAMSVQASSVILLSVSFVGKFLRQTKWDRWRINEGMAVLGFIGSDELRRDELRRSGVAIA